MDWFWTWGGECFGYRQADRLYTYYTYYGLQVGRFYKDEVYGADGQYLGEIKGERRLITNFGKKRRMKSSFTPTQCGSYARYANYAGYAMYAGYEDFPSPDDFDR